jgi:hypothetical protein
MRLITDYEVYYDVAWPAWWQVLGLIVAGLAIWDGVKWLGRRLRKGWAQTDEEWEAWKKSEAGIDPDDRTREPKQGSGRHVR